MARRSAASPASSKLLSRAKRKPFVDRRRHDTPAETACPCRSSDRSEPSERGMRRPAAAFPRKHPPFCRRRRHIPAPARAFGSGRHSSTAASRNRSPLGGLPLPPLAARSPLRPCTSWANLRATDRGHVGSQIAELSLNLGDGRGQAAAA